VLFDTLLKGLVYAVAGANGAILADWEGESVAHCYLQDDDYELKILGAHKGIILNQMKEIHGQLGGGLLQEAVITTADQHVLVGAVGSEYVLVMTLERNALVGLALRRFRDCLGAMYKEIYE
jgi:predicted regulator of Ras-like GTPase activity (Roadblock/LC7/MglB family)